MVTDDRDLIGLQAKDGVAGGNVPKLVAVDDSRALLVVDARYEREALARVRAKRGPGDGDDSGTACSLTLGCNRSSTHLQGLY